MRAVPDHATLWAVLQSVISQGQEANTGMGNQAWAAVVNRDGLVCAIVFSGPDRSAQWPGIRVIAAEKASTANALSGPNVALSTANLYYASQPGQSLFSLTTSAPPTLRPRTGGAPRPSGSRTIPWWGSPSAA